MNNIVYEMSELSNANELIEDSLLILALDSEARSSYALDMFVSSGSFGRKAIAFNYEDNDETEKHLKSLNSIVRDGIRVVQGYPKSQLDFVANLKEGREISSSKKIVIDASCILTPYLFLLIKCIKEWNPESTVYAINTIPFDYSYSTSPFTSYKSYYGDLRLEEILGFSSSKRLGDEKALFIFAGFEGALAMKVVEDTEFNKLYYVNALPSYYQKYKDISFINNYHLIVSKDCKRIYAPAVNPFEVYNILDNCISDKAEVSIAPLCTKPIALGICMFALKHNNIRIIYPFSDKYESFRSHDVYKSYVYSIVI